MPAQRFFIDTAFHENQELFISGKEFSHIVTVMRNKKDSFIEMINGRDQLAQGIITKIEKNHLLCKVLTVNREKNVDEIILYQALLPSNRLEIIIEKGTELGITAFNFFPGDSSITKTTTQDKINRLKLIAISAMKQCGRLDLPTISLAPPIKNWKKENFPLPLFFGDIDKTSPQIKNFLSTDTKSISYVIGPEAGLSCKEINILRELNILGVTIHPYILRTETAAIAFAALIKHLIH